MTVDGAVAITVFITGGVALHGRGTPFGFADLAVFGAITGWVTVRTAESCRRPRKRNGRQERGTHIQTVRDAHALG